MSERDAETARGGMTSMERQRVESSTVAEIGYDGEERILEVLFKKGGLYRYLGVPRDEYDGLMAAESVGSHLARAIKGRYAVERIGG